MLQVIFLGTAGSLPTPDRSLPAILVNREGDLLLFDCGEGTQRQMMIARTGMMRLSHIFLTHLHADHILGIPGLLETMAFQGRENPLVIAGPPRTARMVSILNSLGCCTRDFEVRAMEMRPGDAVRMNGYTVTAIATQHSVPSLGYMLLEDMRPGRFNKERAIELGVPVGPMFGRLQKGEIVEIDGRVVRPEDVLGAPRPGRKIVYSGDTRPTAEIEEASRNADLLIHDGALADDMLEWAVETKHTTAGEAAALAARAGVRRLVLTHISSRYSEDTTPLLNDARKVFPETLIASDLMRIDVPLRDG
ncbi:MAG: ribonuclease Z [Methanothrix sp.]|uniref:Ribonuclease Z n=1 Tax=Methanothrix thermoacetophila (strain DSM 6194 / JCM 14653 / NBRC 101360 / PT) TaxID=349307 RepID=A0B7P1_METTP|nr:MULTISPECIES: ribonuclease Z [Methanothrix]ABK14715.1 RNAse Z [Methanothrix thermoacetophila PT]MBC7079013.1 ribonuclease Z [Methanothrix sp.]NPU87169.1 ribonuclease Z [Methanothrix sp.]